MSSDATFDQEARIFDAARELSAAERDAFLERELGHDSTALERMRRLLAADAKDQPLDGGASLPDALAEERVPEAVGEFRILRALGRGGMGVVY